MEQKQVSRRNFFKKTATVAGAAVAAYSMEEAHLMAFQQAQGAPPAQGGAAGQGAPRQGGAPGQGGGGGRGGGQPAIPDIPGPVPTLKLGGIEVSRLIAGHNLVVGQAHEGGSGLLYVSSLLTHYFTEDKVLETFGSYEKNGINTSGARMAANMQAWQKKYMKEKGGKLKWLAGISSERDIPMANDMGCQLGYIHGNTADPLVRAKDGADQMAKLLDAIRKAGMVGGICCHSLDVVTMCEKAGIKPSFYIKTYNPVTYAMTGGGAPASSAGGGAAAEGGGAPAGGASAPNPAAQAAASKAVVDIMASVKVPWIGFKVLGAGRVAPSQAFPDCFKNGCDAMLVGMYDFQVAAGANLVKQILQDKGKLGRTRPWVES